MTVRLLDENDWSVLRDIRLEALEHAPATQASSREREQGFREQHWRMRLRSGSWWVAAPDGAPAGLVSMLAEPGGAPDDRHLLGLWVRPDARRRGLGRGLVAAVENRARAEGARTTSAWLVEDDGPAAELFGAAGYVPTGARMAMPREPHRTEMRWERVLTPEVTAEQGTR